MWTIIKVFIEFVTTLLLFYVLDFGYEACGNLSFLTRHQTHTPCILEGKVLTTGRPGKSLVLSNFRILIQWDK